MKRGSSCCCAAGVARSCGSRSQQGRLQPAAVATLVLCGLLLGAQAAGTSSRVSASATLDACARVAACMHTLMCCCRMLLQQAGSSSDGAYSAAFKDISCSSDVVLQPGSTADVAAHITAQRAEAAAAGTDLKIRATRK